MSTRYIVLTPLFLFPRVAFSRGTIVPSRITEAEFAIPWALPILFCSTLSRCLFMTGKTLLTLTLPGFLLTRHVGSIIRDLFFLRPRKWHTRTTLVKISSPRLSREKHLPTPLFWPSVTQVPFEWVNCIAIKISGTSYFNRLITLSLKY